MEWPPCSVSARPALSHITLGSALREQPRPSGRKASRARRQLSFLSLKPRIDSSTPPNVTSWGSGVGKSLAGAKTWV